jgi:hypothetical protein
MATKEDLMRLSAPWQIPQAYADFTLPEYRMNALLSLYDNPCDINVERAIFSDRLNAIEDGTYYMRQSMITNHWVTCVAEGMHELNKPNYRGRYFYDAAECYHMLYWIDAIIAKNCLLTE